MSTLNTLDTTQPIPAVEELYNGYNIRDIMAAYAMTELLKKNLDGSLSIKNTSGECRSKLIRGIAKNAYDVADAMLVAREVAQ